MTKYYDIADSEKVLMIELARQRLPPFYLNVNSRRTKNVKKVILGYFKH